MTRPEVTKEILTLTNKAGNAAYFDKLDERKDAYLNKLLKAVKKLKKQDAV